MAGTATRYDTTTIRAGQIGQLWYNVALPGAGSRMTLAADGTPESTANPSAKHIGHTAAGTELKISFAVTDQNVDEVISPVATSPNGSTMELSGDFVQVLDEEALKAMTANFGTYSTAAGYKQFTIGTLSSIVTAPIALIWPTTADPTKFAVVHLYKAMNVAGLDFKVDRTGRSQSPFTFRAYAITSRASADQLGNYWWQI